MYDMSAPKLDFWFNFGAVYLFDSMLIGYFFIEDCFEIYLYTLGSKVNKLDIAYQIIMFYRS